MKLSTVFAIVVNFISVKCYVTHSTKNGDETTVFTTTKSNENLRPKTIILNDSSLYLEDVIFALNNKKWTKEEEPCLNRTVALLKNLQNFTLWAVWDWDSVSSQPQGLLYGNTYHLGNYDECMNAPWFETHPELRSQYCIADVVLEGPDNAVKKRTSYSFDPYQSALNFLRYKSHFERTLNKVTWGICVPDVCHSSSVEQLIGVMLAHSHLGTAGMRARINVAGCERPHHEEPYDVLFYAFIATVIILVAVNLVCTYLNNVSRTSNGKRLRDNLISAFDMKLNAAVLLKRGEQDMNMFYGIKFITMCLVVSGHQYGAFNGVAISNGLQVDEAVLTISGNMIFHKDLAVDTFFMMSGFLLATGLLKQKEIKNLFLVILNRYMRIIVAYGLFIFYVCSLYSYAGSGPLWKISSSVEIESCRKNWWLNLIMLSNYVDTENTCLVVSWYIPCDFHYFVLTLFLFWFYRKFPTTGKLLFAIVAAAAIIIPGVVNYVHKFPGTQFFTHDFFKNPRKSEQFRLTYIKSHTRFAAYLVGFFGGWLYSNYTARISTKISKMYAAMGVCVGLFIMGAVMFTGTMFLWRPYDVLESAIYAALSRPAWACGIALFIVCCSLGSISIFKGFFSWNFFVPLSKLTYGLYLVHNAFILRNMFIARNPHHLDVAFATSLVLGTVCEGIIVSFFIWVFAEAPVKNIFQLCTCYRSPKKSKDISHKIQSNGERGEQNLGYLPDKVPIATAEIISSKI